MCKDLLFSFYLLSSGYVVSPLFLFPFISVYLGKLVVFHADLLSLPPPPPFFSHISALDFCFMVPMRLT